MSKCVNEQMGLQRGGDARKESIFQRPLWVCIFALTAAIAWGWAYPLIKLGFGELQITPDMTGAKMLFAGIRFCISGLIILGIAQKRRLSFSLRRRGDWWYILLFTLLNTTLHYAFFYIGLSHAPGSRSAILNSLSVFTVVILACAFFRSDRFTFSKVLGCTLGFGGILALNLGKGHSEDFSWLGDGMIILNALCGAGASLLTRGVSQRINIFVGTGISLALGGALLIIAGLFSGGTIPHLTTFGLLCLALLIAISTIGFALYNKLLSCNPVGRVAIYNSLIPMVGTLSSCLCLHEPFLPQYLFAALLAALGIYIINKR